MSRPLLDFTS